MSENSLPLSMVMLIMEYLVGIFPNEHSYVRLVTTYLVEYAEDWSVFRAYLSQESVEATLLDAA